MVPKACRIIPKFDGEGFGIPIINVSTLLQEFAGLKGYMVSRVLKIKGFDISIIQRFQGPRDERSQGSKVQRLEGERAPRFS